MPVCLSTDIDVPHCIGNDESDDLNGARSALYLYIIDICIILCCCNVPMVIINAPFVHAADQEQDDEKWTEMGLEFQPVS
jgi:hypothetical protein